ncbi:hypothetical protein [Cellvibrio sp. PSBB006]|uniref:hypothetical protein n=1 Tax=Cellvibrio sp. PSBB006 TaxID=1987723 RepID=UPI000B3B80D6|nr:hypothetical protein [Cellvibrio sp. PSBB006]ARU28180.1 hypothetical protein CBR65_12510 [Cellvibrio sp. PSBB006]
MKYNIHLLLIILVPIFLASCGEKWTCHTKEKTMFSISESGKLGSAEKGCSCEEIRSFELETFGEVDEEGLENDFDC